MFFCPNCNNAFDIAHTSGLPDLNSTTWKAHGGFPSTKINDTKSSSDLQSSESSSDYNMVDKMSEVDNINKANKSRSGDDYEYIINKISDNLVTPADIDNLDINKFFASPSFKKLKSDEKEYVYNKIQDILPKNKKKIMKLTKNDNTSNLAFFVCANCSFTRKIEPGTLIFSRTSTAINYGVDDYDDMENILTLPITRNYICPNDKCPSHEDYNKKEAVFFRVNNTYAVKYVCITCKTIFN
jgi:hypothetical protein